MMRAAHRLPAHRLPAPRLAAHTIAARALRRIGAQMPLKEKCRKATHQIDNAGTRRKLHEEFEAVLATLRS